MSLHDATDPDISQQSLVRATDEKVETRDGERGWDVCDGPRKDGLRRVTMIMPAVARAVTNLAGGAMVVGGYVVGKTGEVVGAKKAVDSPAFHAGLTAWLWANGIFPKVHYQPTQDAFAALSQFYEMPQSALKDNDIAQTPLLLANHICYLDGPILATCFKSPKIVAMAGTRKIPGVGKLMKEMDTVFVDRSDGDSRHATMEAIKTHCSEWCLGQRPMLIFPEGTTTNGESILEFKKGAFVPGVPVRPVLLVYTGQWDPACTTYRVKEDGFKENSDVDWAMQFLGHFVHSLKIRVLPPYVPSEAERADPSFYAQNCQSYMASELHSFRLELSSKMPNRSRSQSQRGSGSSTRFGSMARTAFRTVHDGLAKTIKPRSSGGE
jgi:1-acyl-sn-glycerol-3-phosphate acyltransferase